MFNLILKKLDERGISPRRIAQRTTHDGCEFSNTSPFVYDDDLGDRFVVFPTPTGYRVINSIGECVAHGDHAEHVEDLLPEIVFSPMYATKQ